MAWSIAEYGEGKNEFVWGTGWNFLRSHARYVVVQIEQALSQE